MVLVSKKVNDLSFDLLIVGKLCANHGLPEWETRIRKKLIPKIRSWKGPECEDLMATLKAEPRNGSVETFETMVCNALSTYVDDMPLDKERIDKTRQPFDYLNFLVLQHAKVVESAVFQIVSARGLGSDDGYQKCRDAQVPLEYLHTLIRAYHNKALLLGYLLRKDDKADLQQKIKDPAKYGKMNQEYQELLEICNILFDQYQEYPAEEINRVCAHYGRNCWGRRYEPTVSPQSAQE